MAQISKELLESEWETYMGLKNFLKTKEASFGYDMNSKYGFKNKSLKEMEDRDAYNEIKMKHAVNIDDMRKQ